MSIEDIVRKIVNEELDKRERSKNLIDIDTFCKERKLSRTTLWKERKLGNVKTCNIGKRIFIDLNQF